MDDPQTQLAASPQGADLQEQCESLRRLVNSLLVLVFIVSLTFTIFLQRQYRFTSSQIEMISPQATQIVSEFSRNFTAMQEFVKKLNEYAKTHPDFAPIATKYHLNEVLNKPGAAPAGTNK
jgi:hypothetical protein